jgi:phosphotransferase system enzyme I (PtsI)
MATKKIIRSMNFEDVRETALTVLKMDDAEAVNAYLKSKYAQAIKDLGISSLLGADEEKQN